uniref:Lin1244/Lin1753 domain-containing protein n=1 Tax=Acetomicrobium mobile TaxID=97477 RepID=UPI0026F108A0
MKWFKHDTSSSRTEKLAMLKATRGLEGYGFYWNVLEIIAESAGKTGASASGSACFPLQTWCGLIGVPPQTFRKLAENCRELGLFSVSFREVSGVEVAEISTDALAEMADEYSSRKASRKKEQVETSGECRDNVGTMSAVDKNRTDKNREDIDITSAYAEASADESDGLTSRAEKL